MSQRVIRQCITETSLPLKFRSELETYEIIYADIEACHPNVETCTSVVLPPGWKLQEDGFFLHLIDNDQQRRFTMTPICEDHVTTWFRCLYPSC